MNRIHWIVPVDLRAAEHSLYEDGLEARARRLTDESAAAEVLAVWGALQRLRPTSPSMALLSGVDARVRADPSLADRALASLDLSRWIERAGGWLRSEIGCRSEDDDNESRIAWEQLTALDDVGLVLWGHEKLGGQPPTIEGHVEAASLLDEHAARWVFAGDRLRNLAFSVDPDLGARDPALEATLFLYLPLWAEIAKLDTWLLGPNETPVVEHLEEYAELILALARVARREEIPRALLDGWRVVDPPPGEAWLAGLSPFLAIGSALDPAFGPTLTSEWLQGLAIRALALRELRRMPSWEAFGRIAIALDADVTQRSEAVRGHSRPWEHAREARVALGELTVIDSSYADLEPWASLQDASVRTCVGSLTAEEHTRLVRSWGEGWLTDDDAAALRDIVTKQAEVALSRAYAADVRERLAFVVLDRTPEIDTPRGGYVLREALPHLGDGAELVVMCEAEGSVWTWPGQELRLPWGTRRAVVEVGVIGRVDVEVEEVRADSKAVQSPPPPGLAPSVARTVDPSADTSAHRGWLALRDWTPLPGAVTPLRRRDPAQPAVALGAPAATSGDEPRIAITDRSGRVTWLRLIEPPVFEDGELVITVFADEYRRAAGGRDVLAVFGEGDVTLPIPLAYDADEPPFGVLSGSLPEGASADVEAVTLWWISDVDRG